VCKRWREPDEGIWEGRSGRFHNTHSKVLCWVALDRLIKMHEVGHLEVSVNLFRADRDAIRKEIEAHGYNERIRSYTRTFDGEEVDASLLTLPLYGYIEGTHPRMRTTCARIHEKLARGGLVYRYETGTDDGLPPGEGAFGICSFWAVECVARGGNVEGATRAIEQLLAYANDVGLFAEEIDPGTGAALGNFPQAFTHIGLINAALTLAGYQEGNAAAEGLSNDYQRRI
jgi:GH15 family glucan-1,4-alpha-glucosidase